MEAVCRSETSVKFYRTIQRHIPEDSTLHIFTVIVTFKAQSNTLECALYIQTHRVRSRCEKERNFFFKERPVQHPLRIQREVSSYVIQAFVLLTSPNFSRTV
jgi:ribosomal protein S26